MLTAHYDYDANGNRTRAERDGVAQIGTYDGQDRLVSYGDATYTFGDDGDLIAKASAAGVTHYTYDEYGRCSE